MKSYSYVTETNDLDCIRKILDGDTQKYAILVNRYKDLVYTLAIRMVKNKEEAEEVSQDTFTKAFKSLNKFKGESKFSTWIYSIAYNTSLDSLKKTKRQYKTVTINEFTKNQIKSLDNILDKMEHDERKLTIQNCMQLLPSEDSFLLTLYYFEELSIDEIAQIINLKPNNVKVKLFRSRKKLTSILKGKLAPEILERYG
ncbi:sigma-70 family RNA polymerase sigma factor [Aureibaculum sp. 2210JD6-5]|nr:sigma-70 family RNA polymerase sigma factor [Aureibaculum sp. 2210JD6-5]